LQEREIAIFYRIWTDAFAMNFLSTKSSHSFDEEIGMPGVSGGNQREESGAGKTKGGGPGAVAFFRMG
jgi:hypothetical protein